MSYITNVSFCSAKTVKWKSHHVFERVQWTFNYDSNKMVIHIYIDSPCCHVTKHLKKIFLKYKSWVFSWMERLLSERMILHMQKSTCLIISISRDSSSVIVLGTHRESPFRQIQLFIFPKLSQYLQRFGQNNIPKLVCWRKVFPIETFLSFQCIVIIHIYNFYFLSKKNKKK